jgi:aminoglycoside phosphotransferase (APT) family kinase protein
VAFRHLPAAQASVLRQPAETLAARARDLPHTLVHGDCKVANFAFLPDGRVTAFDWALAARAPVTLELGWYLAVNASRVSANKDAAFARYRAALDRARGRALPDDTWRRIETESALAGAAMLLWSKALAFEEGTPQARAEWEWYLERLPRA